MLTRWTSWSYGPWRDTGVNIIKLRAENQSGLTQNEMWKLSKNEYRKKRVSGSKGMVYGQTTLDFGPLIKRVYVGRVCQEETFLPQNNCKGTCTCTCIQNTCRVDFSLLQLQSSSYVV